MLCAKCGAEERRPNDSYCRPCRRAYQREWQRNNPTRQKRYRDNLAARIAAGEHKPQPSGPGKPGRPRRDP
jgi:hypothetical protein